MGRVARKRLVGLMSVGALVAGVLWGASPAGAGWEDDADAAPPFDSTWGSFGSAIGEFNRPFGVAVDAVGRVFVADVLNSRIQVFRPDGTRGAWGSNGTAEGQFNRPRGLAVGPDGQVYVADTDNHRIQVFRPNGSFVTMWGSTGSGNGEFVDPFAIALDQSGNVYVADTLNDRIQVFDSSGTFLSTWGGFGSGNGQFSAPVGVAVDLSGNVYVADLRNERVQKFASDGTWLAKWDDVGGALEGIAADATGHVYVADWDTDRVLKFDSSGALLTAWGSEGSANGQFNDPSGIAVDAVGNVYVSERFNHRIQKFGAPPVELNGPAPIVRLTDAQTDDSWEIEAGNSLTFSNDGATPFTISSGAPADSLVLSPSGSVGVGTGSPAASLHVDRADGAAQVMVTETNSETDYRRLLHLENNGPAMLHLADSATGSAWDVIGGTAFAVVNDLFEAPFGIDAGAGQDTLMLAADSNVGVGTFAPSASLHVDRADGSARVLVTETNASVSARSLFRLENTGSVRFQMNDTAADIIWQFQIGNNGAFAISRQGTGGPEFQVFEDGSMAVGAGPTKNLFLDAFGNLTIAGDITVNGKPGVPTLAVEDQAIRDHVTALVAENQELRQRVASLEAQVEAMADLAARLAAVETALAQSTGG